MAGFDQLLASIFADQPARAAQPAVANGDDAPVVERTGDGALYRNLPWGVDSNAVVARRHADARQSSEAEAAGAIMKRAAELASDNQGLQPQQLFGALIKDPVFVKSILKVPTSQHVQLLQNIGQMLSAPPANVSVLNEGQSQMVRDARTGELKSVFVAPEKSVVVPSDAQLVRPGRPGSGDAELLAQGQDRELHKKSVDLLDNAAKEGEGAQLDQLLIGRLREMNLQTGAGAAIRNYLGQFGVKLQGQSDVEAFNAIINRLTPAARGGLPGSASDRDVQMFRGSLPQLMNTKEGNRVIVDTLDAMAQDKVARGAIAQKVFSHEMSVKDALKQMQALPNPLQRFREMQRDKSAPAQEPRMRIFNPKTGRIE